MDFPDNRSAPNKEKMGDDRNVIARLASFLLFYKLAFFAGVWGLAKNAPTLYSVDSFALHSRGAAAPSPGLWRYFETWDAHYYLHLAQFGYGDQPMALAFYPLWPSLIRWAAPLFGGNFTFAALILANAFSIVALILLHRLAARRFDETVANRTLILTLAFPGALFFCFPFTESLFFLLCIALFWLLEIVKTRADVTSTSGDDWRLVAGVAACAAGAAFARPTGLFLIIPLAVFAWMRRDNPIWRLVTLAPIIGIAGYFATVYAATGDLTAGLAAQKLFSSQPSILKLIDVPSFVRGFFDISPERGARGNIHDRVWFVLFCSTLWPLWKRDKLWFSFVVAMGLTTAFSVSLMSFMRYLSVIFPCFIVIALWFNGRRARFVFLTVTAIFLLAQIYFLLLHMNYGWVS